MIECVRVTYHMRWLSLAPAHSSVRPPGFTSCSTATNPDDAPSDKSWGGVLLEVAKAGASTPFEKSTPPML